MGVNHMLLGSQQRAYNRQRRFFGSLPGNAPISHAWMIALTASAYSPPRTYTHTYRSFSTYSLSRYSIIAFLGLPENNSRKLEPYSICKMPMKLTFWRFCTTNCADCIHVDSTLHLDKGPATAVCMSKKHRHGIFVEGRQRAKEEEECIRGREEGGEMEQGWWM